MLRLSTTKSFDSKSSATNSRRSSKVSSVSSNASSASSQSSVATRSSLSSGASIGSWDPVHAKDVDRKHILVNDRIEHVGHWFDNASTKPLPGQHRLRDNSGRVITAVKAAEDRKLKETLEFTGMIGKDSKKRMAFKTVNRAVETVPLRTQEINTLTGERGPWKESSIQVDRVPDYSAATEDDERLIADRKRRFPTPKTIIVDGKKVKPSRYYENVWDNRPSVEPFPGQAGIYCQVGNYAEDAADWEKHTKEKLQRYVGYQKKGDTKMRSFRTASFDDEMGGDGKSVNFMLDKK